MIDGCETNRARFAISRSDEQLLALSAMCSDQRGDRLWIYTSVAQREGDDCRGSGDLAECLSGHSGELRRGGGAAQSRGAFARRKTRNEDRMCTARPGRLNQSRELWAGDPRRRWGA